MFALRTMIVGFVICEFAAPAFAQPQPTQKLQKAIQAVYNRMNQAYMNRNLDGFISFYDPNYVSVDKDKKVMNIEQLRQGVQFAFDEDRSIHAKTTIQGVKPWNKGVLILAQNVMKWDADGGTLHMKVIETDEDYWIKSGGSWKLNQGNEISSFAWGNGKPYNE